MRITVGNPKRLMITGFVIVILDVFYLFRNLNKFTPISVVISMGLFAVGVLAIAKAFQAKRRREKLEGSE